MDMCDASKITQLGKSNLRMLVNSIYGSVGSDNMWYHMLKTYNRTKNRKKKIKNILND